jgi:hypothetical protein
LLQTIDTSELTLLNPNSQSLENSLEFDSETLINNLAFNNGASAMEYSDTFPKYIVAEHLRQLPILDDTPDNDWQFNMEVKCDVTDGIKASKSSWLYSSSLNKIFVKINTPLNVYPSFARFDPSLNLFIRAMIVYSSHNDLPEPVKKCPNHKEQSKDDHILCCDNVGAEYFGQENGKLFDERLSVVIPLGNIASNEPLKLTFTCQNSCSGGMNRKSTALIFTLEDQCKNILGRKTMHFKVCSCPRRDKEKDESTTKVFPKKRKLENANAPSTSKKLHLMKQESSDLSGEHAMGVTIKQEIDASCEVKISLPNEQLKREVLRAAYNIVAGEMTRSGQLSYNQCLIDIQKQLGKS